MFQFNNDSINIFEYSDGDEFNTSNINTNRWTVGLGWTRVIMSQDVAFLPKDVVQQNGVVKFIAEKKDSLYNLSPYEIDSAYLKKNKITLTNNNEFLTKYSVGCIISKKKYSYGIHEIRFKLEEGQGIWPAFWFYGGIKNEEIDIFEIKCEHNNKIHVDTHCPYGCDKGYKSKLGINSNWGGWMPVSDYLHNGYNIMALEWKENDLIWYINGYPLAYFKGKFETPMNLYINTSVAKDGEAFKPGPNQKTKWPNIYTVDYFRYWKPISTINTLALKKDINYSISNEYSNTYTIKPTKKSGLNFYKKKLNTIEGNITFIYSAPNTLTILALGKLMESNLKITIVGNHSKKEYLCPSLTSEISIAIDTNDTELTITFLHENYKQTYSLLLKK
jgi:beta-glucanase (GH16 family)